MSSLCSCLCAPVLLLLLTESVVFDRVPLLLVILCFLLALLQAAQVISALEAKSDALVAAAAKAPRVSAVAAKLAWEKELGVFVDLRAVGTISIEGFERIPASQLARSLSKLEDALKHSQTKDIYFLDLTGFHSAQAVDIVSNSPAFAGCNPRVIDGGLSEWIADNGPYATTNAEIDGLLSKLRAEADNANRNEQFVKQFAAEIGVVPPEHDMLTLNEATNEVEENPVYIDAERFVDREAFRKFIQKVKL